jgi:hypothetical protein
MPFKKTIPNTMRILKRNALQWILLAGFTLPGILVAQHPLEDTWMLSSGWLDQDEIRFVRMDTTERHDGWAQTFSFEENGDITYRLLLPEGRGICGNGLLYISQASYKAGKRNKRLRLRIEGGHLMYDRFAYDLSYKILQLNDSELILRKKREHHAEVISEFGPELLGWK